MRPDVVPVEAFPQHHGLSRSESLRLHPFLELWVVHPLKHDPGAWLVAAGGRGLSESGEEASRRGRGEVGVEGGGAPPEKRQRRHRNCWFGMVPRRDFPLDPLI